MRQNNNNNNNNKDLCFKIMATLNIIIFNIFFQLKEIVKDLLELKSS
jgi:hypothetical protein